VRRLSQTREIARLVGTLSSSRKQTKLSRFTFIQSGEHAINILKITSSQEVRSVSLRERSPAKCGSNLSLKKIKNAVTSCSIQVLKELTDLNSVKGSS